MNRMRQIEILSVYHHLRRLQEIGSCHLVTVGVSAELRSLLGSHLQHLSYPSLSKVRLSGDIPDGPLTFAEAHWVRRW
jgi:hypothetical protein